MNFIKSKLIENIKKLIADKQDSVDFNGFFWLYKVEEYIYSPILKGEKVINRVSRYGFFLKEEIIAHNWDLASGKILLKIYDKIKNNEFYFYKTVDGRDHKISFKNDSKG